MGEYLLVSPVLATYIRSLDFVLGVQCLQSLGEISLNFQYVMIIFV